MEPSDSWEEAIEDGLELFPRKEKTIRRDVDVKIEMIHRVLWFFRKVVVPVGKPSIKEKVDLHIYERLKEHVSSVGDIGEVDRTVILFNLLISFGIPSRIYIVLSEEPKCFIESKILGKVKEHHSRYEDCVFSIDASLKLKDQSYHFSKSTKRFSASRYVVSGFSKSKMCKDVSDKEMIRCFDEIDNERMSTIPNSVEKMKRHPKYIVESMLRWDQCIYPKRPVFGIFRGEAVYPRENVIRLRTKEQFYKEGKEVRSSKPYRIVKRDKMIRLYAPWQTCEIVVKGFSESMYQDYFHPNFIPQDCVYIDNKNAKDVAYLIGIPYRICFHGFSGRIPINRGIFIEKKNLYVLSNFLSQYCKYLEMKERNERGALGLKRWRVLIRNAAKYLRIRKSLGLK
ncbi:DNA repair protein Rad4 [Encephalitozoon romaleae SJ-2008]|uniref:DNA repair protein Rad4 n=1 Tax=Encephalitozoon romaleae (strain SJ-2008) TaxID=1178016 RepID=I6ZGQ6_ENCRO|nr:DNA repair protein Rad4 [Encephalitozoon romaleae SJ-2008]AFN82368.1 DNA repair protein Rad4 [Encephalitozoon romaleae SJ-2008]